MIKSIAAILVGATFLLACSPKHDINDYKENEALRIFKVASCTMSLKTPSDVSNFEADSECVAAFLAEPWRDPKFWREHDKLFKERMATCKLVGVELKGSTTCQSVFKANISGMSRGVPVKATFDPRNHR